MPPAALAPSPKLSPSPLAVVFTRRASPPCMLWTPRPRPSPPRGFRGGASPNNLRPVKANSLRRFACPQAPRLGPLLHPCASSSARIPPSSRMPWPRASSPWGRRGGAKPDNLRPSRADSLGWFICPQALRLGSLLHLGVVPSPPTSSSETMSWPLASPPRGHSGGAILNNLFPTGSDSSRGFTCPLAPRRGPLLRHCAEPSIPSVTMCQSPMPPASPPLGHCGGSEHNNPRPDRAGSSGRCTCPQASRRERPLHSR